MSTAQATKTPPARAKGVNAVRVLSVGIDVSCDKLDLAMLYTDHTYSKKWVFENNEQGIKSISNLLKKQKVSGDVPCVIESTGNYHLQSTIMIDEAGFEVKLINPLTTKKYQKSSIRGAKSDPIDAARLAKIGVTEENLYSFNADRDTIVGKKLVSYLSHLEKIKQSMESSLKQMREIEEYIEMDVNLDAVREALRSIEGQIEEIKSWIVNRAPQEAKDLADACRGLSREKVAVLFSLAGDRQFSSRDQLTAFLGMDVSLRKSGKWQGRQKLTKRGEPIGRKVLYQIAWGLKQHNPEFREYYNKLYRRGGKHYNTAMMALGRKFLRLLYAYYWQGTVSLESISK